MSMKLGKGRQNYFLTSVLRQPLRSLVLFMLIGVAAFGFVMRTTEFLFIRNRLNEVAGFYRSIGFLRVDGEMYANVLEGAELITNSPFVGFEDRRRGVEAMLVGMYNADFSGNNNDMFPRPGTENRWHYSYFYGTVKNITRSDFLANHHGFDLPRANIPNISLEILVDDVMVGFPEHVVIGQTVVVEHIIVDGIDPLLDMEVGQRYFVRAGFYFSLSLDGRELYDRYDLPYFRLSEAAIVGFPNILDMRPLSEQGIWYVHVPYGDICFELPGLEDLADEIEQMRYNHSAVWLRTTADMSAIPIMQEQFNMVALQEGRLLNHIDYIESRPVAVVDHWFARLRGLSIGDTITVNIPATQQIVGTHHVAVISLIGEAARLIFHDATMDFMVQGDPHEFLIEGLELEIVGTISTMPGRPWLTPSLPHVNYIFIPDSLLVPGFMPLDELHMYPAYVWDIWYSFMLADTRSEQAFMLEYRDRLTQMGFDLILLDSGAENFWKSADPILQSITLNAIMFWIVLLLVFGLVAFLYLNQRKKEFAIVRALGAPAAQAVKDLCVPVILFGLLAIVAGGVLGWFIALREAANVMNMVADIIEGYEAAIQAPLLWLVMQIVVIAIIMLAMIYEGVRRMSKLPVFVLLQGKSVKMQKKPNMVISDKATNTSNATNETNEKNEKNDTNKTSVKSSLPVMSKQQVNVSVKGKTSNLNICIVTIQLIYRHIVRSPLKSALTAVVALFFISAIGLIYNAIQNYQQEIDRLYDTTIVTGEIRQTDPLNPMALRSPMGNLLLRHTVEQLLSRDIIQGFYAEAGYPWFMLLLAGEDGNVQPRVHGDMWDDYSRRLAADFGGGVAYSLLPFMNPLFAVNDLDALLAEFDGQRVVDNIPGVATIEGFGQIEELEPLEIHFAPGYSEADFMYYDITFESPIPVIISEHSKNTLGLLAGDIAFIGNPFDDEANARAVKIIGYHTGGIQHPGGANAVLMPLSALELMFGNELGFITFRFEVDTAHNREIAAVRDEVLRVVRSPRQNDHIEMTVFLWDEELRVVVGQMEQGLSLLWLLYPVTIAVSVVIGAVFGLLIMLQNAKVAAIMRVLGYAKSRVWVILCVEHCLVAAFGVIVGFIVLLMGIGFVAQLPLLALLYMLGATTGSVVGVVIITHRAPLDLLQVRE